MKKIFLCLVLCLTCNLAYSQESKIVSKKTGTGLDSVLFVIKNDEGLLVNISGQAREMALVSAYKMNAEIINAIKKTNSHLDGVITPKEIYTINTYILSTRTGKMWLRLHGHDSLLYETGYHLVQNDGALWKVYGENGIDTVFNEVYHIGFTIKNGKLLNENGDESATVEKVAYWLNQLLEEDLKDPTNF